MNSAHKSKDEKIKQIKSKNDLLNIKSHFIIQKIFDTIKKNKSLEIMKYYKKLQNRLNLTINNYKEYFKLYYSPIEIELKLVDKVFSKIINFINIPQEEKEYYHIYFDDSKEEVKRKRNHVFKNDKVKKINITINYQVKSFKNLFQDCKCISSIFFKQFHRINITDMSHMFHGCSSLKDLNLSNFNTNNVTDMSHMFHHCSFLKKLNLSNFNTNNVINMNGMFMFCKS